MNRESPESLIVFLAIGVIVALLFAVLTIRKEISAKHGALWAAAMGIVTAIEPILSLLVFASYWFCYRRAEKRLHGIGAYLLVGLFLLPYGAIAMFRVSSATTRFTAQSFLTARADDFIVFSGGFYLSATLFILGACCLIHWYIQEKIKGPSSPV